jgi:Domain of unknown function (DUF1772)
MDELRFSAVMLLGLLSGALLTEAAVLVPHWRGLAAEEFLDLHAAFAARLFGYFAPLTTFGVLAAAFSGAIEAANGPETTQDWLAIASGMLAVALLAFYWLYFAAANQELPLFAANLDPSRLRRELRRWQLVHIARTAVCLTAFACAALALG